MRLRPPARLRWWHLYLVLVVLSGLWQTIRPREPEPGPYQRSVEVPVQTPRGPVEGRPVRIAYRESGSGPPVIYLHGSPGSGRDARRLARHLAAEHRFVAPDLPGFGGSSRRLPDYGIDTHARYVLAFMDALGVERAHFVCHSMGSGVAFHMARTAPQRVASIVAYAGIGVQEGEGSGDYHLERVKYAAGYAFFVVAPEFVPHFGLLGPRASRHAFIRNFWDSDQRPLRAVLESLETPLLLLHGRRDPLVPAWAAREHHRIVRHSELVMMEGSHFMVFSRDGAERLAGEILPFLARHEDPSAGPARRTIDYSIRAADPDSLSARLGVERKLGPWMQVATLAAATFVSEDLTCISAGLLAREGRVDFFVAILGCALGIYFGDIGLWLLGRGIGRRILRWRWIAKRVPAASVDRFGTTFDRHVGKAVMASRFLPGARLPMYIGAGIVSKRPMAFMVWLFAASWLWTPILVMAAMVFGPIAAKPFETVLGVGWPSWVGAILLLYLVLRVSAMMLSWRGRARLAAAISRLWRWEFWPVWLFYLPLAPWIVWLAIRRGGVMTPTASNPAFPHGGFVGESKGEILRGLPDEWVQPGVVLTAGPTAERVGRLEDRFRADGWEYPLVLKPDQGERGFGLKLARAPRDVERYLASHAGPVLVQTYHPGPHEAGVFYYRIPGEPRGRIFSITGKRFPEVGGDGGSTLEELVLRHPRYRMQAAVFLHRLAGRLDEVPRVGERVPLAVAGNHCQGTMFLEGGHLHTPELERAIDNVARSLKGFYFGRFDLRYTSPGAFARGRGFKILELNGVTSESTNVYDPSGSLLSAYVTLARQWSLAFEIGQANRRRGNRASSPRELLGAIRAYYRDRRADPVAD